MARDAKWDKAEQERADREFGRRAKEWEQAVTRNVNPPATPSRPKVIEEFEASPRGALKKQDEEQQRLAAEAAEREKRAALQEARERMNQFIDNMITGDAAARAGAAWGAAPPSAPAAVTPSPALQSGPSESGWSKSGPSESGSSESGPSLRLR
jgi:hypothetical protein